MLKKYVKRKIKIHKKIKAGLKKKIKTTWLLGPFRFGFGLGQFFQ